MCWRIIIPVFLIHAFNVKSIFCIVNYMIINNIHNRTAKSGILFTEICIRDFFNRHDFMKYWSVQVNIWFTKIICEHKLNQSEWLRPKRVIATKTKRVIATKTKRVIATKTKRGCQRCPRGTHRSFFHIFTLGPYELCVM